MPKAEAGTPKALANKMKSKGLQRLRWYCQVCERQMRDENGFKQHTLSEAHNRNMIAVGSNAKAFISDYSSTFRKDFVTLLRTAHGEKPVKANNFYQEYIANKEHTHMNATKWPSLTEFCKFLGREGICRVTEDEKGLFIAWIDDSPEALRRKEAVIKRDRQDRGDEEREQKLLRQQIERAQAKAREFEVLTANTKEHVVEEEEEEGAEPKVMEPIKFGFGTKKVEQTEATTPAEPTQSLDDEASGTNSVAQTSAAEATVTTESAKPAPAPMKIAFGTSKPKNVFAESKKSNPLKSKKIFMDEGPKKMSEAERIMKEEMSKKRHFSSGPAAGQGAKRMRL